MNSFYTGSDISTITDQYQTLPSGRPRHIISPKKKDKAWILQMVKCANAEFRNNCPNLFFNSQANYTENIRYFQALLDPAKYQDLYDQNQSVTKNQTSVARDKRILNVASKYIRILKGRLSDLRFDITATPVNALARQHEEEFTARIRAAMEIKKNAERYNFPQVSKMLEELGFDALPVDNEELEIQKSNLSMPYQMAMCIELFLNYSNQVDGLEKKLSEQDLDVILQGVYATKVRTDGDGTPVSEKIDPRSLLVGFSNTEDFRDVSEIGQYRSLSASEMKEEDYDNCLTDKEITDIEERVAGQNFSNSYNFSYIPGRDNTLTKKSLVLDLYFYSWDEEVKVMKNNSSGNPRIHMKDFSYYIGKEDEFYKNNPTKKIFRTKNQVVYKATWVVGTDYIYNYGLLRDMARSQSDPYRTRLPILIYAPLIKDGQTHSIMDEIKPVIDSAQLKWQRIQEAIAKALPPGMEIDIDGLLGAVEALGDKDYNISKILQMAFKENIHILSGGSRKYGANNSKSVTPLYGGLGPDFNGWMEGLRSDLFLLQEITGLNSVAAGSPDKYTGKGVSDNAMATADYSIKHLFNAKRIHFEDICKLKTVLGMDQIASGNAIGIKKAIGVDAFDYVQINAAASKYEYNIVIEERPSAQMWADIYNDAQTALAMGPQQGGIDLSDSLFLKECTNFKQAKAYLYITISRHKRETQQQQQQIVAQKAQMDRDTAQNSSMIRQQELQMQGELDKMRIQYQKEADLEKLAAAHQYKMIEQQQTDQNKSSHINQKETADLQKTQMQVNGNMDRLKPSFNTTAKD